MKTLKYISLRAFAIAALALVFAMPAKAQMTDNGYANIDWQFNFPLNNHFADKASGWGMNFEGGYFLTSNFALGGFLSYHSNHEYFDRQTLPVGESGSLNTDQQHTVFQLPFGLATRYAWNRGGAFQPYLLCGNILGLWKFRWISRGTGNNRSGICCCIYSVWTKLSVASDITGGSGSRLHRLNDSILHQKDGEYL